MGKGEQSSLTKAVLARHWGVSRAYATKLAHEKNMPEFATLEEADAWRAVHAPPKAANLAKTAVSVFAGEQSLPEKSAVLAKKIADSNHTTTADTNTSEGNGTDSAAQSTGNDGKGARYDGTGAAATSRGGGGRAARAPRNIDVESFVRKDVDFDMLMVEQAQKVPQIAHGLLLLACEDGEAGAISAATKNWHEAAKAAAGVRGDFIAALEKSKVLIHIDPVMDIIGTELQELRNALVKFGDRVCQLANPPNPSLAKQVIDAAMDEVFKKISQREERIQKEVEAL